MLPTSIANVLGCGALITYALALMPSIFHTITPSIVHWKRMHILFSPDIRRGLGIASFFLALVHAIAILTHRRFEFQDPQTYLFYFHGTLSLGILAALTLTSNHWSQKHLKRNWKKLQQLTYLAMILILWHVISAMWGKWETLTFVMIGIMLGTITLFLVRKGIEYKHKHKSKRLVVSKSAAELTDAQKSKLD